MEAGQLPKGCCNTTGTYVQTTQHLRHTYALGSWSGKMLQKTSSNWTQVQTKKLSEERTESAVAVQCVWMHLFWSMCVSYLNTSTHKKTFYSSSFCNSLGAYIIQNLRRLTEVSDFASLTTGIKKNNNQTLIWKVVLDHASPTKKLYIKVTRTADFFLNFGLITINFIEQFSFLHNLPFVCFNLSTDMAP